MKIKKELIKREIAGDTVLVPVGKTVYDSNGLFVMNGVGAFIWDLLPQVNTAEEIVVKMTEVYEVPRETAEADVKEFLSQLEAMEIL